MVPIIFTGVVRPAKHDCHFFDSKIFHTPSSELSSSSPIFRYIYFSSILI